MRLAALAFFLWCGAVGVRLAAAGYRFEAAAAGYRFDVDSARSVEQAANSVECAEYAARLATLDPDRAPGALDQAIRWNPRSSAARIARGLQQERAGDFDGAARDFLAAAEVDHQYLPAWTLANFYFRRADRERFRKWARRSAEWIPGDVAPLVALCDRMDPGNALTSLPQEPRFEWAYFDLLIGDHRLEDAGRVAAKLAKRRDPGDIRRLTGFTTRLIDAGQNTAAIAMWRELFPGADWPVNPELRAPPSGDGFDWRVPPVQGVASEWSAGRLSFRLDGHEPESCVLLEQPEPIDPGPCRLRFEYSGNVRGIRWMLDSARSAELDPADRPVTAERSFPAGHSGIARLRLIYRRDPGVAIADGTMEIRSVRWEPWAPG